MEINIVAEAFKFMLLGMGIVFLFLIFLVYVLKLQAKLVQKYFPDKELPQDTTATTSNKKRKIAAAIAAIAHHKNSTS
ncbi:MAG: OadG family protein [Campylobacterota bacterium]